MADADQLHFEHLPCFFNYLDRPGGETAPFTLVQDPATGLVSQKYSARTAALLEAVYKEGSILTGGTMSHLGFGRQYADGFMAFLLEAAGGSLAGRKILEVGCGTGYFLSLMKERGAEVLGIEPGGQGQAGAGQFDVPVVDGFYPSPEVTGRYDFIVSFGVLEHIADFGPFLAGLKNNLRDGGRVLAAVPDAGPFLAAGDISILIHEHWHYFTAATLAAVLGRHGLSAKVSRPSFGGLLYALAEAGEPVSAAAPEPEVELNAFAAKFRASAASVRAWMAAAPGPEAAGIYVPGRALNLLSQAGGLPPGRLFDDEPQIHGRYCPGLPRPIENFQDLKARPVEDLLIFSRTFGPALARKIRAELPGLRLRLWRETLITDFSG